MVVDRVLICTQHMASGARPVDLVRAKITHVYESAFIFTTAI